MKLSELMNGVTPNAEFEGIVTAGDMVLAVDFSGSASSPADYIVADGGVTEQSGALEATTAESTYLRSGTTETKTGTKRTFTVAGDRMAADDFQEALLAHAIKYGTGQSVIKKYVYFCMLTGKGEQGSLSIAVEDDQGGEAGANATWSATLTAVGTPTEYTYSPASMLASQATEMAATSTAGAPAQSSKAAESKTTQTAKQ